MMTIGDLIREGNRLKREGKLDEAIALYHQIIEVNPNFSWAHYNLGNVFVKQRKLEEAVAEYRQAIEINPSSALFLYSLGKTLDQQGDSEVAAEYLQKAVEVKSDRDQLHHELAQYQNRLTENYLCEINNKNIFRSQTLEELYSQHTGKVSDKWSSYLLAYDQILKSYRNMSVKLLEIGVQNGGSLEIWSKYLYNAELIIGCDINPKCSKLIYKDPRIHIILGDVNTDEVKSHVTNLSESFDIIIDDGSHTSSDIIRSFARFFPLLQEEGVYIAEDLHTSYWEKYQGGLFYPFSSVAFFKHLVDIINHEHWGIEKERLDILNEFSQKYGFKIGLIDLQSICSITFLNSLCVIKKCNPEHNNLGKRCVAGLISQVTKNPQRLNNTVRSPQDQRSNEWSVFNLSSDEQSIRNLPS